MSFRRCLIALASALFFSVPAQAARVPPEDILVFKVLPADAVIAYGSNPFQFGELRLPKGKGPFPLAIMLHGGCWTDGNPGAPPGASNLMLLRPLAAALADARVATWNVEYRRNNDPGGGWPGTFADIIAASDYVRVLARSYPINLSRIIVMGHSSGGQLALLLAARSKFPASHPFYTSHPLSLIGVLDIDGPPDLAAAQPTEMQFCPLPAITKFMGGSPAAKPVQYREASASSFLPLGLPQAFVVSSFRHYIEPYQQAAIDAGDPVLSATLKAAGHSNWVDTEIPEAQATIGEALTLIRMAGAPLKSP